jgi:hypothetical protein
MFIRVRDSHSRSIVKAVSWRVTGSVDTFVHRLRKIARHSCEAAIRDDPEQLRRSITALGRYNTELGQVSAQGSRSIGIPGRNPRNPQAPPDERGGNRYVLPNATAPHLDSTKLRSRDALAESPLDAA